MWKTSCTSVSPSAHQSGQHQAGAGADVRGPYRRTRQVESRGPPVVSIGPGIAPRRIISSTNRNRASNTFSVIIDVPSAIDAKPMAIGCRSVGNPERQGRDVDGLGPLVPHDPEAVVVLGHGCAGVVQLVQHQLQMLRVHPVTATSPCVIAAAIPRSPPRCGRRSPGARSDAISSTPVMVSVGCRPH